MIFDVITIFPEIFKGFTQEGILAKAIEKNLLRINIHDLRNWVDDKHKKVDDKPFGGGLGMVMKVEPILRGVAEIKKLKNSRVILFSPAGKKLRQSSVTRLSKYDQIVMISGRYEGVDERVALYIADEEISIGDYVLMGGDIPAMAVMESISRLIPGVIGKDSFLDERIDDRKALEYPQYTRPASLKPKELLSTDLYNDLILKGKKISSKDVQWDVPDLLVSGDHSKIAEWRKSHGRVIE
jgi:tRNA (guanine-N1)-methyltransferase